MNIKEFILNLEKRPEMYCSTKEAFLCLISGMLITLDIDCIELYYIGLPKNAGNTLSHLQDRNNDLPWVKEVCQRALHLLYLSKHKWLK